MLVVYTCDVDLFLSRRDISFLVLMLVNCFCFQCLFLSHLFQVIWTEASKNLYVATNYRAYFGEVIILIPNSWTNSQYPNSVHASHYLVND